MLKLHCREEEVYLRDQTDKYSKSCKKNKTGRGYACSQLENVLIAWYQQAWASNIPVHGNIIREKAGKIAAKMKTYNLLCQMDEYLHSKIIMA
jgi:hypothetical protein